MNIKNIFVQKEPRRERAVPFVSQMLELFPRLSHEQERPGPGARAEAGRWPGRTRFRSRGR